MFGACSQFQIGILKEEKENWLVCGFWLVFFFYVFLLLAFEILTL